MALQLRTTGIHHVALRVTDLPRAKRFYIQLLGFTALLESVNLFIFAAGETAIAVRGPEAATTVGDAFNPFRVGLDHVALACHDPAELEKVARSLTAAGVENTGVKIDPVLNRSYVAFKDPERIQWELYMAR
jgi:catechol 2,3-dioxygenase-like lactoylglutathione lyase family enzyme